MTVRLAAYLLVLTAASAPAAQPFAEPPDRRTEWPAETFGDARNVSLLAGLLGDSDLLVREQAVRDLGATHNALALPHIVSAMGDAAVEVRCAAIAAWAEFPIEQSGEMIRKALAAEGRDEVMAALQDVRRLSFADAAPQVAGLLAGGQGQVESVALQTLTLLGKAAPAEDLKALLRDADPQVRLRAAENALLLERDAAASLLDDLVQVAGQDQPAARGEALAALGKLAYASAEPLLPAAKDDPNPLVRLGAVRAWHNAGKADRIGPMLDDKAALVRLGAVQAAGDLKCADCVDRLLAILLESTDDQTHYAARKSLALIGVPRVSDKASATLERLLPALKPKLIALYAAGFPNEPLPEGAVKPTSRPQSRPATQTARQAQHELMLLNRNVRACCWLLGELKSTASLETQIAMLKLLPIDSEALIDAAIALGKIGDRRAVAPLAEFLAKLDTQGKRWRVASMTPFAPPVPYNEVLTAGVIQAMGDLNVTDSVKTILSIAATKFKTGRLPTATVAAMFTLPRLTTDANRADISAGVTDVIGDADYGRLSRYMAMKVAGKLKLKDASSAVTKVLTEERPDRTMMLAAAWAVHELTGQSPQIGDPVTSQDDNWVIRKAE